MATVSSAGATPPSAPPQLLPLPIPTFYHLLFTTIDPILGLIGALLNLFSPLSTLNSYTPSYTLPLATETTVLLQSSAGFFAAFAFLQIYLLRRTDDLLVWRAVQGALVVVDFAMLAALVRVLVQEGRLDKMSWRGEDWMNVGVYSVLLMIRLAFVSGIGMDAPGDPEENEDDDHEDPGKEGKAKKA